MHGAFDSLAFGIGTSEVEHVLATQTLLQKKGKNVRVTVDRNLAEGVTSKDVICTAGCVIEYAGSVFRRFSMETRMRFSPSFLVTQLLFRARNRKIPYSSA